MMRLKFSIRIKGHSLPATLLPRHSRTNGVKISMDGRGRCQDNIFIERLCGLLNTIIFTSILLMVVPICIRD